MDEIPWEDVGMFGNGLPERDGRYSYEPYRSGDHHEMRTRIKAEGKARCYYETSSERVSFTVRSAEEYGMLDISEIERRPR